ncbi:response regulator [Faecalimonas umbilicata]|nr:response regulator [Faecalimonas umbilicata]
MYKIFLADDEIWVIMGLKKLIEKIGAPFQVVGEASNGVMALEEIEKKKPDVLITDIRMPGMDGLELMKEIRKKKLDTKVVLVSGYAEFDYAQKAIRMGAVDYLLKPVEAETFAKVLENLEKMLDERGGKQEEQPEEILNPSALENIVEEIQARYNENITLTGFSEKHNISAGHLSNLLKERLGMSFSEYITAKRVQKAKELLADERLSVEKVANEVGYKDYFYFTKVFKKAVGISPSKYRKNL